MEQAELLELSRLLRKLGEETEVSEEEARVYLPDISDTGEMEGFYLPRVSKGFYTGCFEGLRKLTLPKVGR